MNRRRLEGIAQKWGIRRGDEGHATNLYALFRYASDTWPEEYEDANGRVDFAEVTRTEVAAIQHRAATGARPTRTDSLPTAHPPGIGAAPQRLEQPSPSRTPAARPASRPPRAPASQPAMPPPTQSGHAATSAATQPPSREDEQPQRRSREHKHSNDLQPAPRPLEKRAHTQRNPSFGQQQKPRVSIDERSDRVAPSNSLVGKRTSSAVRQRDSVSGLPLTRRHDNRDKAISATHLDGAPNRDLNRATDDHNHGTPGETGTSTKVGEKKTHPAAKDLQSQQRSAAVEETQATFPSRARPTQRTVRISEGSPDASRRPIASRAPPPKPGAATIANPRDTGSNPTKPAHRSQLSSRKSPPAAASALPALNLHGRQARAPAGPQRGTTSSLAKSQQHGNSDLQSSAQEHRPSGVHRQNQMVRPQTPPHPPTQDGRSARSSDQRLSSGKRDSSNRTNPEHERKKRRDERDPVPMDAEVGRLTAMVPGANTPDNPVVQKADATLPDQASAQRPLVNFPTMDQLHASGSRSNFKNNATVEEDIDLPDQATVNDDRDQPPTPSVHAPPDDPPPESPSRPGVQLVSTSDLVQEDKAQRIHQHHDTREGAELEASPTRVVEQSTPAYAKPSQEQIGAHPSSRRSAPQPLRLSSTADGIDTGADVRDVSGDDAVDINGNSNAPMVTDSSYIVTTDHLAANSSQLPTKQDSSLVPTSPTPTQTSMATAVKPNVSKDKGKGKAKAKAKEDAGLQTSQVEHAVRMHVLRDQHVSDLLLLDKAKSTKKKDGQSASHPKVLIDGQLLEENGFAEAFGGVIRNMVEYAHKHARADNEQQERDPLHLFAVDAILDGTKALPDPITDKSAAEQQEMLDAHRRIAAHGKMDRQFAESFYDDILRNAVSESGFGALRSEPTIDEKKRLATRIKLLQVNDANVPETLRFWERLSRLRQAKCVMLLLFRTTQFDRLMRRASVECDSSLLLWNGLAQTFYNRLRKHLLEMQTGDYRGRAQIPAQVASGALQGSWDANAGRWHTTRDAVDFSRVAGVPDLRENLLATEECYEYGFLGYPEKQGMPFVTLLQIGDSVEDSCWRCVCVAECEPGTVFGFAPHIFNFVQEPMQDSEHIYALHPNVQCNPFMALGPLSFIERVHSKKDANVVFALDYYCDLAAPDLYSCRLAVVASCFIGTMTPLKVFMADRQACGNINQTLQEIIQMGPQEASDVQQRPIEAYAVTLEEVTQHSIHLYLNDNEAWAELLDRKYYRPNINKLPQEPIEVSRRDLSLMIGTSSEDLEQCGWVQQFQTKFQEHRNLLRQHTLNIGNRPITLDNMRLTHYSLSAIKATGMYARVRNHNRKNVMLNAAVDSGQSAYRPIKLPQQPAKGLHVQHGTGHFAVAIQMLYSIQPVRQIFQRNGEAWRSYFPPLRGNTMQNRNELKSCMEALDALFKQMAPSDNAPVETDVVLRLVDAFCRYSQYPREGNGDAHEVFMLLHGMLLQSLFSWNEAAPLHTTGPSAVHGTRSTEKAAVVKAAQATLDRFYTASQDSQHSSLVEITLGMMQIQYQCKAKACAQVRYTSRQPFFELEIAIPANHNVPVVLQDEIAQVCREGTLEGEVGPCAHCKRQEAVQVKTEVVVYPQYIVLHLNRQHDGDLAKRVSPAEIALPSNLTLDLGEIAFGNSAAQSKQHRYDIISTVERRQLRQGLSYSCFVRRQREWFMIDKKDVLPALVDDVRARPGDIEILLLERA